MAYQLQGDEFTVVGSTVTYNLPANKAYLATPNTATSITTADTGLLDGTLHINNLPALTDLVCHTAKWYNLDLNSYSLENLDCSAISSTLNLDLTGCPALVTVDFGGGSVTSVNAAGCAFLTDIIGAGCNNVASITVTGCVSLNKLSTYPQNGVLSPLTEVIGLSDCENVTEVTLMQSSLTSFDATGCVKLQYLTVNGSRLTENIPLANIDVTDCPDLVLLDAVKTSITSADMSGKASLESLYTTNAPLTYANVAGTVCIELFCENGSLPENVVDDLLAQLVANDVAGGTCALEGNAPPSAAGLASKAMLEDPEGLGWTVTVSEE